VHDAFNNANNKIINIICNGNAITDDVMGKILCDVRTNGNVCLGFTMWDIHTNRNVCLGFTVWDVHMNGNNWACIIVCDGLSDRTRALFAPRV
jgi:hypothetical protein